MGDAVDMEEDDMDMSGARLLPGQYSQETDPNLAGQYPQYLHNQAAPGQYTEVAPGQYVDPGEQEVLVPPIDHGADWSMVPQAAWPRWLQEQALNGQLPEHMVQGSANSGGFNQYAMFPIQDGEPDPQQVEQYRQMTPDVEDYGQAQEIDYDECVINDTDWPVEVWWRLASEEETDNGDDIRKMVPGAMVQIQNPLLHLVHYICVKYTHINMDLAIQSIKNYERVKCKTSYTRENEGGVTISIKDVINTGTRPSAVPDPEQHKLEIEYDEVFINDTDQPIEAWVQQFYTKDPAGGIQIVEPGEKMELTDYSLHVGHLMCIAYRKVKEDHAIESQIEFNEVKCLTIWSGPGRNLVLPASQIMQFGVLPKKWEDLPALERGGNQFEHHLAFDLIVLAFFLFSSFVGIRKRSWLPVPLHGLQAPLLHA